MTSKEDVLSLQVGRNKLNSDKRQKHDFSNLVLEFRYAVERQDRMTMAYCEVKLGECITRRA